MQNISSQNCFQLNSSLPCSGLTSALYEFFFEEKKVQVWFAMENSEQTFSDINCPHPCEAVIFKYDEVQALSDKLDRTLNFGYLIHLYAQARGYQKVTNRDALGLFLQTISYPGNNPNNS